LSICCIIKDENAYLEEWINYHRKTRGRTFLSTTITVKYPSPIRSKYVNENFIPVEGAFSAISINKIQLNHYYCRSLEEFEEKMKRGIADTRKGRIMEQFTHHDQDSNKVKDTTILELMDTAILEY
jgi:hypothetical protein